MKYTDLKNKFAFLTLVGNVQAGMGKRIIILPDLM